MSADINAVMSQVASLMGDVEFKARLMAMLTRTGYCRIDWEALDHYRIEATRRQLALGMSRAEVRNWAMATLHVSYPTAYRLITRALDQGPR